MLGRTIGMCDVRRGIAFPLAAAAETLELPPGAVMLQLGSVRSRIDRPPSKPSARNAVPNAETNRSALGLELPPGALVIYPSGAPV